MDSEAGAIEIGGLPFKNPVLAASSEATMTESGILACLRAGAGAVVAKSINEAPAAARQLAAADYVLLNPELNPVPWAEADGTNESLFCRSGLPGVDLDEWTAMLARCDAMARKVGAYVIGSITVGDPQAAPALARRLAQGVRLLELNLSAPHGREAPGVIHMATDSAGVRSCVSSVKEAVDMPVIAKLTAQSGDVVGLAEAARDGGADAIVLTGRYLGFVPDLDSWEPVMGSWGAIGGRWALPITLYWVSKCHLAMPDTPIIATNGVRTGSDVVRSVLAGASAVEMASTVMSGGPETLTDVIGEFNDHLAGRDASEVATMVGHSARRALTYAQLSPTNPGGWPWERD